MRAVVARATRVRIGTGLEKAGVAMLPSQSTTFDGAMALDRVVKTAPQCIAKEMLSSGVCVVKHETKAEVSRLPQGV